MLSGEAQRAQRTCTPASPRATSPSRSSPCSPRSPTHTNSAGRKREGEACGVEEEGEEGQGGDEREGRGGTVGLLGVSWVAPEKTHHRPLFQPGATAQGKAISFSPPARPALPDARRRPPHPRRGTGAERSGAACSGRGEQKALLSLLLMCQGTSQRISALSAFKRRLRPQRPPCLVRCQPRPLQPGANTTHALLCLSSASVAAGPYCCSQPATIQVGWEAPMASASATCCGGWPRAGAGGCRRSPASSARTALLLGREAGEQREH